MGENELCEIGERATSYNAIFEEWPGQLADLQMKEKTDPTFKEKFAWLHPNPVKATLSRIKNKNGSEIATKIFAIYDSLESITSGR